MKYCTECGGKTEYRTPKGDNRQRYVCTKCGHIHYQNPHIVVGTIPVWEDQILMCRRAISPGYGQWTLPAGHMEMHETTQEGAIRETKEEAHADVTVTTPYFMIDLPFASSTQIFYIGTLVRKEFRAGEESLEVRLFKEEEIPWEHIAFFTVKRALRNYFSDRRKGTFPFHYDIKYKEGPKGEPDYVEKP
ncbi:MAG: NUDIX hydrolase [Burkholderiales bacterium]|nr:NUDIX hydrolase [Burkholderiales bacterium]